MKALLVFLVLSCILLFPGNDGFAQVMITADGSSADNSAMLEIKSADKGVLIPRLDNFSRNQIPSPAPGLLVFNTTTGHFNAFDGDSWCQLESSFVSSITGVKSTGGGISFSVTPNSLANNSAMLDISDQSRGVLFPRTTPELITAPAIGLIIYNNLSNHFQVFYANSWHTICSSQLGVPGAIGNQNTYGSAINSSGLPPDPSSILDVVSSNKGVLLPRLSESDKDQLLPVEGLTLFNTSSNSLEYYNGTAWYRLNTMQPLSINITSSVNPVVAGIPVTFSASCSNGGANPTFQWFVNGINTGVTGSTYSCLAPANSSVSCIVNSSLDCIENNPGSSNVISVIPTTSFSTLSIISSNQFTVPENQSAVGSVIAINPGGGAITYSIAGGADSSLFSINSSSGLISFNVAPDFENPGSSSSSNTYSLVLQTINSSGQSTSQSVLIFVTDVNEPPVMTSSNTFTIVENNTNVGTVAGFDPESTILPHYYLVGGEDSSRFNLDASTGALSFKIAPDFEIPVDADHNNQYLVNVKLVDNDGLFVIQPISVSVTNEYLAETEAYIAYVDSSGGSVLNVSYCDNEIAKAKNEGYLNKIAFWVDKQFGTHQGTEPAGKVPMVTFNFDDSKTSDFTQLYNTFYLQRGLVATSYINTKFILNGTSGYLTPGQVTTMHNAGWDFQCHAWSHARSNQLPGGDVNPVLGLTGCTNTQILEEILKSDTGFTLLGLPPPRHFAYPNYVTNYDSVMPIVAKHRVSLRGGDSQPTTADNYKSISWFSHRGNGFSTLSAMEVIVDKAILNKEPTMFSAHTVDQTVLGPLLDYITSKNVDIVTTSQYYTRINNYRNKLFNVTCYTPDYEPSIYFDNGTETAKQGIILFGGSLNQVGSSVADYYVNKGYRVGFWTDNSQAAMAYTIPNNTIYYDGVNVTADPAMDFIILPSNGFSFGMSFYLTGDVAPGNLSFNTKYYVQGAIGANSLRVSATSNGPAIDITSAGSNLKLHTYGYRDILYSSRTGALASVKDFCRTSGNLDLSYWSLGGNIADCGFQYLLNPILGSSLYMSNNFLTGGIPVDFKYLNIGYWLFSNNKITGGLANLPRVSTAWYFGNNLLNEAFPSNIGYWHELAQLDLSNNQISGTIPIGEMGIGKLTKLKTLYLFNNNMSGTLPAELGNLTIIERIRCQNNHFSTYETGAISTSMMNLLEINLNNNNLPSAEVNKILADVVALVNLHPTITGKSLNLGGLNMGAPTGQGLLDKSRLQTVYGWTVTTN
ncbi:MAG: polysaccharide deacetylase family protein [Bacteroidetes bacterium]|nr:polysaccharide deacetylase family protein [Bacteroidota bacterium]